MPRAEITGSACSLRAIALMAGAGLLMAAAPPAARSKAVPRVSEEVVQPLPARNSNDLNAALARLGRNPRDVAALIDAGKAALAMGDADAAVGFFGRADQVSPGNAHVKAGLASALVRNENPYDAIPLFEEAAVFGTLDGAFTIERGLAYDMVGDNATAQRYYRDVLARGSNDEATRRLALSLAMSGDKQGAERTLASLLARRDKSSFRARAFALAITGNVEDAVAIAYVSLPQPMAASIAPYLRYMPRLTRAQQAAAANFGHFPRASEIGRDDPRVARYTASTARVASAASPSRAVDRGKARPSRRAATAQPRTAPPEPQVRREVSTPSIAANTFPPITARGTPPASTQSSAAVAARPVGVTPPGRPGPQLILPPQSPKTALPATPPTPHYTAPSAAVGSTIAQNGTRPAAQAVPPAMRRSVAGSFGDFTVTMPDAAPTAGAVDIRRITPARPKPKVEAPKPAAKPLPPAHPSRIWVQVATGRDKDALAFDWRRMSRQAPEAFRGKKGSVSDWGARNRLLAGPFPTEAAANAFMGQLRTAKVDGSFVWTSPAGQVVDALPTS